MQIEVIVLAAGQGTRMRSRMPKVLHPIGGQPMLRRVLDTVTSLEPLRIHVVVGHVSAELKRVLADVDVNWVDQTEQRGTGHAVLQALPDVETRSQVLVVYGDCPLVTVKTLEQCLVAGQHGLGLITAIVPDPTGLGRIVRTAAGEVEGIIEHADISHAQCEINEINSGILSASAGLLRQELPFITDCNAQGEIYLTDLIGRAVKQQISVNAVQATDYWEVLGVNDRVQLAQLERVFQRRQADDLLKRGVSLADPNRFDCRGSVDVGQDCEIDINVLFEGHVELGDNVRIGPNCILRNVQIASGTIVHENTVLADTKIGQDCRIGPFARIRPGSALANNVQIGNFVEIKQSHLNEGVKAGHLTYIGDAEIGAGSNIGAGSITCNFDGKSKHRTIVGDNVFIGSNTSLIAPLTIDSGAAVAAGSAINRDVKTDELAIERAEQRAVKGGGKRFRRG